MVNQGKFALIHKKKYQEINNKKQYRTIQTFHSYQQSMIHKYVLR